MKEPMMDRRPKARLARFFSYYKNHRGLFALDMSCAFLIAVIDVAYPWVSKVALDRYLPSGMFRPFFIIVFAALAAYILRSLLEFLVVYLGHMVGVHIEADMRRDIFSHIQTLSFSFFDKTRTGALMSRCTNDLNEISELAHHGPEDVFISVLTFFGAFAVMLTIEWRLALILMACVPLMLLFVMLLRKQLSRASRRVKESLATINAGIESSVSGARVAKAFANEYYEVDKFDCGNGSFVSAKREYFHVMGKFFAVLEFFTNVLKVAVLGVGGYMIMKGSMDIVVLLTFTLYVTSFVSPIRKLTMLTETYTMGMAGFTRFCEIMDTEPEIADRPDAVELSNVKGRVEFRSVSFSYDGGRSVLNDVNLSVEPGKKLALVGPSGGGKTTLCHLIPRFYDVKTGSVTVDGVDVRHATLHSLRANIGIVQQDVFMFADTVRENIRYGRLDATDAEIMEAARLAEMHEEIMEMPDGYDTVLGERGITLSGGQKQRMSIARIFLKNPPILILDEATSALDSVTEARINASFERLSRGRTTIAIAHRLSTVLDADEILVIVGEHIIERGTHKELMDLGGEYSSLYAAQQKGD